MTSQNKRGKELISSWANVVLNGSSDFSPWELRKTQLWQETLLNKQSRNIKTLERTGHHIITELCPIALSLLFHHSLSLPYASKCQLLSSITNIIFLVCGCLSVMELHMWGIRNHFKHSSEDCGAANRVESLCFLFFCSLFAVQGRTFLSWKPGLLASANKTCL